jgi:hypothetical protein
MNIPTINLDDFQGLTFKIVKLEEIKDISAARTGCYMPPFVFTA